MFEDFLYLLRKSGLKVSLTEWMSLMEAMDKGLHGASFTGFDHLCRCLLVTVGKLGLVLLILLAALCTGLDGRFAHLLWLAHGDLSAHEDREGLVVDLVDHVVEEVHRL